MGCDLTFIFITWVRCICSQFSFNYLWDKSDLDGRSDRQFPRMWRAEHVLHHLRVGESHLRYGLTMAIVIHNLGHGPYRNHIIGASIIYMIPVPRIFSTFIWELYLFLTTFYIYFLNIGKKNSFVLSLRRSPSRGPLHAIHPQTPFPLPLNPK